MPEGSQVIAHLDRFLDRRSKGAKSTVKGRSDELGGWRGILLKGNEEEQ